MLNANHNSTSIILEDEHLMNSQATKRPEKSQYS